MTNLTSLLLVQQEIGAIKKDSSNPFFRSKYFDINAILREVKPILNKHGLVLIQPLTLTEGRNAITTSILEASTGDTLVMSSILLPEGLDPQKTGSAITYFRRYALQSLLALEAEDDDGNIASGNVKSKKYEYPENDGKNAFLPEPTDEEVIEWVEKLESATSLKQLKSFAEIVPPMVKEKIGKAKFEEIKSNIK